MKIEPLFAVLLSTLTLTACQGGGPEADRRRSPRQSGRYEIEHRRSQTRNKQKQTSEGRTKYLLYCSRCHRSDLEGNPPETPSIKRINNRMTRQQVHTIIREGTGDMAPIRSISREERKRVVSYLFSKTSRNN